MKFQDTGYTIKLVQQQIHTAMEDLLRPLSLTISQYNVLKSLGSDSLITGAELARRAFVTPQTMHVILTTLERKQLITRASIHGNTKSINISRTAMGGKILDDADVALAKLFDRANASLTTQEYDVLEKLLRKLSSQIN